MLKCFGRFSVPYIIQRQLGHSAGLGFHWYCPSNNSCRNSLFVAAQDMNCWPRPSPGSKKLSNNFVRIHSRQVHVRFCNECYKEHHDVTHFLYGINRRFYSNENNEYMKLAERFRNDSEAKSYMQELLTDFERLEPVTEEERTIVQPNLEPSPTLKEDKDEHFQKDETSSSETRTSGLEEVRQDIRVNQHQVTELSESMLEKDQVGKDVFNIQEIVDLLKEENVADLCVIQLPKKMRYVDYMVLVTGRSTRHLKAMAQHLNQKYKEMKAEYHSYLTIEGKDSTDWMCIDFGNIVVHFMLEEAREIYELEKLWTLGPEFDDQSQRMNVYEMRMFNMDHDLKVIDQEKATTEEDSIDENGVMDETKP
ncbi:uncharacterized protein LOC117104623 [Anneissia japonica]|uniref:uncharacterized protein LOC117104623 n=1 Tax=Anneissia japonica TaxID=1529436 RepID=UPI001425613C|nr:uncharacterized protein LOC117104623 [Anneissia japonica]